MFDTDSLLQFKKNPFSLQKRNIVILGGTSGVGFEVAKQAIALDANVFIGSSNKNRVEKAISRLDGQVNGSVVDVRSNNSLKSFFNNCSSIDHVCWSIASKVPFRSILDDNIVDLKQDWNELFWSVVEVIRVAYPKLRVNLDNTGHFCSFTIVTGTLRLKPVVGKCLLTVSQLAIEGLVKSLAIELAPVRFNIVAPGVLNTELWKSIPRNKRDVFFKKHSQVIPLKCIGNAENAASLIIVSMYNNFMTGSILVADGGESIV